MVGSRTIAILVFALFMSPLAFADTTITAPVVTPQEQTELNQIKALKVQLYNYLSSGNIESGTFDEKTELAIAQTQMAISNYYLTKNDRKYAAICALIARKILQNIYGSPTDPQLIPIYSLLVQIYSSAVDIDEPNVDVSDAERAKLYRQLIDHIHAE